MAEEPGKKERFEVLYEEIGSQVQSIAEGHSALVRGQETLVATIDSLSERIGFVEKAVTDGFREMRESFGSLSSQLQVLVVRLDAHEHSHKVG